MFREEAGVRAAVGVAETLATAGAGRLSGVVLVGCFSESPELHEYNRQGSTKMEINDEKELCMI